MFSSIFKQSPRPLGEEEAYLQKFLSNKKENLFMGSYPSFQAAQEGAPVGMKVGYEAADSVEFFYSHQVCSWDYAPIFWLNDAIAAGKNSILDIGGHVGIKYYAFKRIIPYPPSLRWRVFDVPSVVRAGERLAQERSSEAQLSFCTDYREAKDADVLLLSGSLQYMPQGVGEILGQLKAKPWRVILNITAVHPHRTMFTLNSIGSAVCPYRIQHQDEILSELRSAGYRRRDLWRNDGKPIVVPFVEGGCDAYYFGCCFDLAADADADAV